MSPESQDMLEVLCKQVDKKYGQGTITKYTDEIVPMLDVAIPTGSIGLDVALGIGGYRRGRIVEVYGGEAAGKSSLCLHAVANEQKRGKDCLYVDAEQSLDIHYAKALGCDIDRLLLVQPDYAEMSLDIVDMFTRSELVGLIVVDSVAALVPKAELEGDMDQASVGRQALLMSKAMRKLVGIANKTGTTIIFVNQIRYKIGVQFGSPETLSGGNSLKYYASQRLDVRRIGNIKSGENIIGNKTKVTVVKNKVAPPKKVAEFDIIFGRGIDSDGELVDLATEDSIIVKSGAWYKYNDDSIAQGRQNAILWLNENPDIKEKIRQEILSNRGLGD